MSSPNPASLRDLYAPPSSSWSFAPPVQGNSSAVDPSSSASSSHQWSTRSSQSPLYNLSSTLVHDDSGIRLKVLVQGVVVSALLQYASSAISIPWDVGKTLLQVQWVPRDAGELAPHAVLTTDQYEDDEGSDSSSNADNSYFVDPHAHNSEDEDTPAPRLADEKGYVVRQSVLEEGTIPDYVIPVGSAAGTWGMMKRLGRFQPEGWLSLWKGLLTTAIQELISASLQPVVHSLLESLLTPAFPSLNAPISPFSLSSLIIPVASQVVTGFILSPLDLVRTRLMVQTAVKRHRAYSGPIDALQKILEQEGGLYGIYFHPHLFLPTILDCTLRSLVPFTFPAYFASRLYISPETHPLMWTMTDVLGRCAGLLVTLPFETIRKRLQVQVRGTAKPLKACVELRPAPYNGMVDALWHILTEERSDLPLKPRKHRRKSVSRGKADEAQAVREEVPESESWLRHTGVGQLYRGLGLRFSASAIVFLLTLFNGNDETDAGWTEL